MGSNLFDLDGCGILLADGQFISADGELDRVAKRCHFAHRNGYTFGDPHIHDSTFGCAFTMEPNHSHRLTRSDIFESFYTLFLLHYDSVSQVVIKGDP